MKVLAKVNAPAGSGVSDRKIGGQAKSLPVSNDLVDEFEPLLSCWEALDGKVRLILSRKGQLIARSKGADQFFHSDEHPGLSANLILACTGSPDKQLRRIFSVAVGEVEAVTLPKQSGDGHYLIIATGISASAIAVAVRVADGSFMTRFADLEEAFGLTRCEVLVIEALVSGHVAQQIADDLAISVHTVRAHLRHCYEKLGVSSREELWQRLAPYRLN